MVPQAHLTYMYPATMRMTLLQALDQLCQGGDLVQGFANTSFLLDR